MRGWREPAESWQYGALRSWIERDNARGDSDRTKPILSPDRPTSLRSMCRSAAGGAVLTERTQFMHDHPIRALLTERSQIQLIAEGLTNKEIAQRLRLAEGTVKVHLHHIYRKLGIANRTALAVLAHTKALDAAQPRGQLPPTSWHSRALLHGAWGTIKSFWLFKSDGWADFARGVNR